MKKTLNIFRKIIVCFLILILVACVEDESQNDSMLQVLKSNDIVSPLDGEIDTLNVDELISVLLAEGFSREEIDENIDAIIEQLHFTGNEKTDSDIPILSEDDSDFNGPVDEDGDVGSNDSSESDVGSEMCPAWPAESARVLEDSGSGYWTEQQRALSGDNLKDNLYERPFTSGEMNYRPDLDIYTVEFAYDDDFFFYTINLHGIDEQTGELQGIYGIEFDRSLTGRGDLLVLVENLSEDWSVNEAIVLGNKNDETDNSDLNGADEPIDIDYDKEVFYDQGKVVCARLSPDFEDSVQIAISRLLLNNPEQFLWGAWAFEKFEMFQKHDSMEASEAGSPIIDSEDYPLTGLYNIDNTCRLPYGFEQVGRNYPGMCFTQPSSGSAKKNCTTTCTGGATGAPVCKTVCK